MEAKGTVVETPEVLTGILREGRDLSQWVPLYTSAIAALGIAVVASALTDLPEDWLGLTLFISAAAIAELTRVELFRGSRSGVSVSSIIAVASILVFGPLAGALVHMASGMTTVAMTSRRREPRTGRASWLQRSAFNMGMFATSAAVAGGVYVWAGGTSGEVYQLSNILPLVGAATADTLANVAILIGVLALQTGRHPLQIWAQDIQWGAPISIAGGIIGGGALALAYEWLGIVGLTVFFLPVVATSYSFRLYVANMRDYVNQLEEVNRDLDEANLGLLETLGAVIDADDVYTHGHSTQVAVYAEAIAEKMGLTLDQQVAVVKAALVHDVGKVGVMDSIIGKQGPLTHGERNMVKRHPVIGAEIVGRMKGLQHLVPAVRHHHECWDGRGYPDGLKGKDIPLEARILALADALDAMCSDRPYRPTRSFAEVREEIARFSGIQFDPDVVTAFFALTQEKDGSFFKNSAARVDEAVLVAGMGKAITGARYLKKSMIGLRN